MSTAYTQQLSRRAVLRRSLLAAGGLAIGGTLLHDGPVSQAETHAADPFTGAQQAFAFRLFDRLIAGGTAKNTFISPLSIAIALSMTAAGARGSAQQSLLTGLGLSGMSVDAVGRASAALIAAIVGRDTKVSVEIADSFWARKGLTVLPEFAKTLKTLYGADINNLDFSDEHAAAVINAWVSKKTHGLIPTVISGQIPAGVMLYLINAVYFHGKWSRPFADGTSPQPFTLLGGGTAQVPLMSAHGEFMYYSDTTQQVIQLPYGNGKIAMCVLLPAAGVDFNAYLRSLSATGLNGLLGKLSSQEGSVKLPRFTTSYGTELIPTLRTLGMAPAFSPAADLSGMLVHENPALGAVLHKALIAVDEQGTKAAGTTVVIGVTAVRQQQFTMLVNRPFFLAIRDQTTGIPLFMGSIVDPR